METILSDRVLELEVKAAYQERTIEALNEVILELREDFDRLRREFETLRTETQDSGGEIGSANEKPPHY